MQSGISVTPELHDAFNTFTTDSSLFCLPITITSESLTPLPTISSSSSFTSSLSQLSTILKPQTPIYLLLRRDDNTLVALTYIPSNAPVRAKTLFASTRATLVRELGSEKFGTTIFATEEDEVVGENAWKERDAETSGKGGGNGYSREDLMGDKERELELVRRAEEEARSGTLGRDIGIGGSVSVGGGIPSSMRVQMPADEEAKEALTGLQAGGLVQLIVDVKTETLKLVGSESSVDPNSVQSHISSSSPQYTYYHYPDSDAVIFIYTCPSGSKIKERMLFASSRNNALVIAGEQGLKIARKIEAFGPDEISGDRLREEVFPPQDEGPKRGFARPKRPGR
ncbi:twinfilin [Aspergillus glaucus CBS 516.65]|uniref:Twinfilin n=1 Tax=Aspergillus glaucus CBS 516.65 TaxID=1160497 RepID=A0A1L9VWY2_ASPGL|nr:hypothetical protein ASPGLDRAFT_704505 [Aspergillus glaucus CBS 516.65]OJJ88423.1 hypothetical protein ASPGLDRAFT_704505 [Aspergillus glaucus CBS 516.65]